jgi:large subunit ribosomal protein L13
MPNIITLIVSIIKNKEITKMKTKFLSKEDADKQRKWYIVDAKDQTLGRLATKVASTIRGKNKPTFTPHVDCGDFVVVINADKVRLSGNKLSQKMYRRHTGYFGGLKEMTAQDLMNKAPERLIEFAVSGMLPSGPLGRSMRTKLKVYAGSEHPHTAQQPQAL